LLKKEEHLEKLRLWDANDRALVFVDQKPVIKLYDRELLTEAQMDVPLAPESKLDILVENMGRVNFGLKMEHQRKGINGSVQVNGHQHFCWQHYPLPLDNLDRLDFSKGYQNGLPAFYLFEFDADTARDTYLDYTGWGKGCALINGFNLGRFWELGPQKHLYIPGPLIKEGKNTILLFETDGVSRDTIRLTDQPDLG
jgi:beta-galactosidase